RRRRGSRGARLWREGVGGAVRFGRAGGVGGWGGPARRPPRSDGLMTWLDEVARGNPEYVESLYRDYCRDPAAVEERWRLVFAGYELARNGAAATDRRSPTTQVGDLVHRYREFGHLIADLDPLGQSPRQHPFLQQDRWGFTESDLD